MKSIVFYKNITNYLFFYVNNDTLLDLFIKHYYIYKFNGFRFESHNRLIY